MKNNTLKIAFFGSSIVSAYWNGAATYYRGMVRALHELGHHITFFEPDAYGRQQHRDMEDPEWCEVVVYPPDEDQVMKMLEQAASSDIIIKASGVGAFDELLEHEIPKLKKEGKLVLFWDVDAPATLERMQNNINDPFREQLKKYDCVLTYGGGLPVIEAYQQLGAKECIPVYNALDTSTHFPVEPQEEFRGDLAFLGNRLPDRETRVDEFFVKVACLLPQKKFLLGGSGWEDKMLPPNIKYVGHVYTAAHNAFNCTPLAVLNISRDSMATTGYSPATRVFEAAGAAACIITDYWKGIEDFFEPDKEILVAKNGDAVSEILKNLTPEEAERIGKAAYKKVLEKHTYKQRASQVHAIFERLLNPSKILTHQNQPT